MDDFTSLPIHVQNALKRAGVTSAGEARALGREALSNVPGVGPLALNRLFAAAGPAVEPKALSPDELARVKRWFETVRETAPETLGEADHALAAKIARWVG